MTRKAQHSQEKIERKSLFFLRNRLVWPVNTQIATNLYEITNWLTQNWRISPFFCVPYWFILNDKNSRMGFFVQLNWASICDLSWLTLLISGLETVLFYLILFKSKNRFYIAWFVRIALIFFCWNCILSAKSFSAFSPFVKVIFADKKQTKQ